MHWPLPPPVARHEICQVVKLRWSVVMCAQTESCHLIYLQETLWQKNSRVFARRQLIIKQSFLMRGASGEIN